MALLACQAVVGRSHALDMILRGLKIDGPHAYRIGLVSELLPVAELKTRAQALGEELAAQPRQAVKSMLDTVVGFETKTLAESMADEVSAVSANRGSKFSKVCKPLWRSANRSSIKTFKFGSVPLVTAAGPVAAVEGRFVSVRIPAFDRVRAIVVPEVSSDLDTVGYTQKNH